MARRFTPDPVSMMPNLRVVTSVARAMPKPDKANAESRRSGARRYRKPGITDHVDSAEPTTLRFSSTLALPLHITGSSASNRPGPAEAMATLVLIIAAGHPVLTRRPALP